MDRFLLTVLLALVTRGSGYLQKRCISSLTTVSGTHAPRDICSGQLIFEDNFDTLDTYKWEHENTLTGGGNYEFQWYTNNRSNSFTKDGRLFIKPTLLSDHYNESFLWSGTLELGGGAPADRCTNPTQSGCRRQGSAMDYLNPIKSARLRTVQSFNFQYGRVEVSAKMPAGDWIWPAIWLLPSYNAYGPWPASGEIDLAESRGNRNLTIFGENIGVEQIGATLHYGPYLGLNSFANATFAMNDAAGYQHSFRRYQMEWTPDYVAFSIDDNEYGRALPPAGGFWKLDNFVAADPNVENPWRFGTKMAPFDQQFHIVLNLAVGGINFFPDEAINPDPKPWKDRSPTAAKDFWEQKAKWLPTWDLYTDDGVGASLQVDYVRVWAL